MCDVCFALYGLRPRERAASEGRPKRGRRSFRASAEVPRGVSDDGTRGGERAPEDAVVADDLPNPRPFGEGTREKVPVILRASLRPRAGGRVAAGLLPVRPVD
jgi:hypothetical protein